ncbi:hypothetical protein SUGI_0877860 [Cryptomeria japonica]|nr:hypothetical protein SUGI_0877860 [Cryptomeria japonica]
MEHLEENLDDWFAEQLEGYLDDDYLVFDCPGQIELYSHFPVFRAFVDQLKHWNYNVCAVYLLDSQFLSDITKYLSGCMPSLSAMIQLELPHVNILTKMDLVKNKKEIEKFLDPDIRLLLSDLNQHMAPCFAKLNRSQVELIDDYSMVNFLPLDITKENIIQYILSHIDNAIKFGEDVDVKVKDFDPDFNAAERCYGRSSVWQRGCRKMQSKCSKLQLVSSPPSSALLSPKALRGVGRRAFAVLINKCQSKHPPC